MRGFRDLIEKRGNPPSGGGISGPAGSSRPVKIHDAEHADFRDGLLHAALTVGDNARKVFASADLAFELKERSFYERAGVGGEFAEDDAAVPGGCGLAFARIAVLPHAMRR
jgi:hypothetical protein